MAVDVRILSVRGLFGATIAAPGAQKAFGWSGSYGLKGTGGFFETLGFRPGVMFAALAGLSELVGGLFLVHGLRTPLGAAAVLSTMLVGMVRVHLENGFFVDRNGIEMAFLYASAALGIARTGRRRILARFPARAEILDRRYVPGGILVLTLLDAILALVMRRQNQLQTTA